MDAGTIIFIVGFGSLACLGAMIYVAMQGEYVVFRDKKDVMNSVLVFVAPFVILGGLGSLFENPGTFVDILMGIVTFAVFAWFSFQVIRVSIECNGMSMGIVIGLCKVLLGLMMIIFVWGLLAKVNRGEHKNVGTAALMVLFAAGFLWVMNTLINGDEVATNKKIMSR
jgi:hypothetical protein